MADLTRDDVAHLAGLARIDLSDAELDRMVGELGVILEAVATVQQAPIADVEPMSHPMPIVNVTRPDLVRPCLTPEEALAGATRNAARALGIARDHGTLEVGKAADLVVWDIDHPAELSYWLGGNPAHLVVRGGRIVAGPGAA